MTDKQNVHKPEYWDALTVVSPMCLGGEEKDQDRACWYRRPAVACICDGLTSSPYSAEAARIGVEYSPALFGGNIEERLSGLADVLLTRRWEAQSAAIRIPPETPAAMWPAIREAARQRLESAYQTTLVAASLTPTQDHVTAGVLVCGDSALFAFSPAGDLLTSTLSWQGCGAVSRSCPDVDGDTVILQPGAEILVKAAGRASSWPQLVDQMGIAPQHAHQWVVCIPLDRCEGGQRDANQADSRRLHRWRSDDILLVPMFLLGHIPADRDGNYCRLRYSKLIRQASMAPARPKLNDKGSVTAVLPDHVHCRRWIHHQDRFPLNTHFLLASDGFYGCFLDAGQLWAWLQEHEHELQGADRDQALRELHASRHSRCGDDDISFVWVRAAGEAAQVEARAADSSMRGTSDVD